MSEPTLEIQLNATVVPLAAESAADEAVTSIKGFNCDWTCRGYQFAVGQTYTHVGDVEACSSGFHAIEGNPLEVFDYYPPGQSRYAEVEQSGALGRHGGDSKLASATLTIKAEIHIPAIVERAVRWIIAQCVPTNARHAEGYRSAASSTGYRSAASSTGYRSAASSTGDRSAASSTGDWSAASSTGYQSAASSTGYQSAASSTGYRSAASSTGYQSAASSAGDGSAASSAGDRSAAMASGAKGRVMCEEDGCALFLVYRDPTSAEIKHAWAGITGVAGIKAKIWYQLGADGHPVEASQ